MEREAVLKLANEAYARVQGIKKNRKAHKKILIYGNPHWKMGWKMSNISLSPLNYTRPLTSI